MHYKNENDIKLNTSQTQRRTTTATITTSTSPSTSTPTSMGSGSTSSTDSGVVIIDNKKIFGNSSNNFAKNNISNNNNNLNNSSNKCWTASPNNGNIKSSNLSHSGGNDAISRNATVTTVSDKIENTTKVDNFSWNEKLNDSKNFGNNKCNDHNCKSKSIENENFNVAVKNINIENVINISKGHHNNGADDANGQNHLGSDHCSPTVSIRTSRSPSISISSIDENANDSSIIDSDSDREAEGVHTNYVVKKLGQQTTYAAGSPDVPNINKGLTVISQKVSPNGVVVGDVLNGEFIPASIAGTLSGGPPTVTTPQIGSIALTNSTDVTFGDKHFYEGPVTIQQILIDRREKWKAGEDNAHDNPMFEKDPDCDNSGAKKSNSTPPPNGAFGFIRRRKYIVIISTIIMLAIFIGIIVSTMKFSKSKQLIGDGDDSRLNIPINSTIGKDNIGGGLVLRIVARDGWLAQPPSKPLVPLDLPVPGVIVIATNTDICSTQASCTFRVRFIQTYNIESLQNDDIIYNFLIGGDGNVYEGRGWNLQGAHMKGYNNATISLAYIGTFRQTSPNEKQMYVTKLLLEEGVRLGKLSRDFKMYPAKKFDPTSSDTVSATALYESFKDWPHWSDT